MATLKAWTGPEPKSLHCLVLLRDRPPTEVTIHVTQVLKTPEAGTRSVNWWVLSFENTHDNWVIDIGKS